MIVDVALHRVLKPNCANVFVNCCNAIHASGWHEHISVTNCFHGKVPCQILSTPTWLELLRDELRILPSATREEDEPLKTAGPLLEELTSLLTLDRGWLLVGCVHPPLRIPTELPTEESLEPGLKVFGVAGSIEPALSILWSLLGSFEPRLTTCGDEGSAEPLLKDLR